MALAQLLIEQNFPAIAIHRGMGQEERLSRYQQFKDFQKVNRCASKMFWLMYVCSLLYLENMLFGEGCKGNCLMQVSILSCPWAWYLY
jgi:hypothetical protein